MREHTFWGLLEPFLNFHGPNLQSPCESRARAGSGSDSLRFKTCFSLGLGSSPGSGSSGPAWYNLRKMEFQPSLVIVNEEENNDQDVLGTDPAPERRSRSDDETESTRPPYTCYISSRCSVQLNQSLCISAAKSDRAPIIVPIFICELPLDPGDFTIFLLTIKVSYNIEFIYILDGTLISNKRVSDFICSTFLFVYLSISMFLNCRQTKKKNRWRIAAACN